MTDILRLFLSAWMTVLCPWSAWGLQGIQETLLWVTLFMLGPFNCGWREMSWSWAYKVDLVNHSPSWDFPVAWKTATCPWPGSLLGGEPHSTSPARNSRVFYRACAPCKAMSCQTKRGGGLGQCRRDWTFLETASGKHLQGASNIKQGGNGDPLSRPSTHSSFGVRHLMRREERILSHHPAWLWPSRSHSLPKSLAFYFPGLNGF